MAKRAQFSELNESQKHDVSKKCFKAVILSEFRGSVIKENYHFASPKFILDKAVYYFKNYANNSEKIEYMDAKKEHDKLIKSHGIYYQKDTKYQKYIEDIVEIDNMEDLNKYIKGNNPSKKEIPIHSLNLAIQDRSRAFGNENGLYSKAKDKLLAYEKYKYDMKTKQNKAKSRWTLEENILMSKITLQDFLTSDELSKQDYCHDKGLSINVFDKRLSIVKEYEQDFYKTYLKELKNKEEKYYDDIKPVVEDILDSINTNKEYNIIDYYLKYHDDYKFIHLYNSCNKYHLDIRTLKSFFSKVDIKSSLSHDAFINQNYMVHNHLFKEEEKEDIYDYLKENAIPTNWENISLIVNRYYKNKEQNKTRKE